MNKATLTEKEVASHFAISVKKLQKDRSRNEGIPYLKIGSSVRYEWQEIQKYTSLIRVVPISPSI